MKKFTATLLLAGMMLSQFTLRADEGMWLVSMLNRITMAEAQGLGLNLSAEEIYDINGRSMKSVAAPVGVTSNVNAGHGPKHIVFLYKAGMNASSVEVKGVVSRAQPIAREQSNPSP